MGSSIKSRHCHSQPLASKPSTPAPHRQSHGEVPKPSRPGSVSFESRRKHSSNNPTKPRELRRTTKFSRLQSPTPKDAARGLSSREKRSLGVKTPSLNSPIDSCPVRSTPKTVSSSTKPPYDHQAPGILSNRSHRISESTSQNCHYSDQAKSTSYTLTDAHNLFTLLATNLNRSSPDSRMILISLINEFCKSIHNARETFKADQI